MKKGQTVALNIVVYSFINIEYIGPASLARARCAWRPNTLSGDNEGYSGSASSKARVAQLLAVIEMN